MKVVFDTNVFIAAALKSGLAEDILQMAADTDIITLLVSKQILSEVIEKLQDKFHWLERDINSFIDYILEIAQVVDATEQINEVFRDPEDNKILECAVSGQADLIVSSDQDLIKLKKFKGIGIIHPKTLSWTFPEYFKKIKKV